MSGTGENPRIFVDTNVFFSAFYSPDSPPGMILRMMLDSRVMVVISRQVLGELVRAFKAKLPGALPALKKLLESAPLEVVDDPAPRRASKWEANLQDADASIFAAAIDAGVDYFITGDNHFLRNEKLKADSRITIISPSDYMRGGLKDRA